jgi:hypothetical protein
VSYREDEGNVVLTMTRADYDKLLMTFAAATMGMRRMGANINGMIDLLNRLNEGNPNYEPYCTLTR